MLIIFPVFFVPLQASQSGGWTLTKLGLGVFHTSVSPPPHSLSRLVVDEVCFHSKEKE